MDWIINILWTLVSLAALVSCIATAISCIKDKEYDLLVFSFLLFCIFTVAIVFLWYVNFL
jgi:hypothetical protein